MPTAVLLYAAAGILTDGDHAANGRGVERRLLYLKQEEKRKRKRRRGMIRSGCIWARKNIHFVLRMRIRAVCEV